MSKPCSVPSCPALARAGLDLCRVHNKMNSVDVDAAIQVTFGMVPPLHRADLGRIEYEKPEESK